MIVARRSGRMALHAGIAAAWLPFEAAAQETMPGMDMPHVHATPAPNVTPHHAMTSDTAADRHARHVEPTAASRIDTVDAMAGMATMDHAMPAMLGPYSMAREASGTAWQPDSAPVYASMVHAGAWSGMAQGFATIVYDDQGGPRGDTKTFSQSMTMVMASRPVGDRGRLGLRAMLSLDPLMGKRGYPLLFATGETADGRSELVDRQHPHDLFMELAASYSLDLGGGRGAFVYAGLPGEPALGPPTFMHRLSGMDNPEAPIGHHWFDSTHVTFGVVTAGYSTRHWKLEASAFRGREPDQHRWDIETPKLDSWSVRGFWNPTANVSMQVSTGFLRSPEQLHPGTDEQRTTASATLNLPLGSGANWASTIAWSLKDERPGPALHGWLAESAYRWADRHTLFARAEHVDEAELFDDASPLHHQVIPVGKFSLGYQYELPVAHDWRIAIGGLASAFAYPRRLEPAYGAAGIKSFMLYTRITLGDRRA